MLLSFNVRVWTVVAIAAVVAREALNEREANDADVATNDCDAQEAEIDELTILLMDAYICCVSKYVKDPLTFVGLYTRLDVTPNVAPLLKMSYTLIEPLVYIKPP